MAGFRKYLAVPPFQCTSLATLFNVCCVLSGVCVFPLIQYSKHSFVSKPRATEFYLCTFHSISIVYFLFLLIIISHKLDLAQADCNFKVWCRACESFSTSKPVLCRQLLLSSSKFMPVCFVCAHLFGTSGQWVFR